MLRKIFYLIPILFTVLFCEAQNQPTTFSGVVGFDNDGFGNYTNIAASGWNNNMLTSANFIAAGQDGSVKHVVVNKQDRIAFGLSASLATELYDITYRFQLQGNLYVWNGNALEGNYGRLAAGDILEVVREGSEVAFKKNGVRLTSIVLSSTPKIYVKATAKTSALVIPNTAFVGEYYETMEYDAESIGTSCIENSAEGAINLTVGRGKTPYTYSWSNGATTKDIASLIAGIYTVTVTDAANEQIVVPITVGQEVVWNYCEGQTDGESLYFDGNNDYIETTAAAVLDNIGSGDFTFEAWVNGDESMSHPTIFCNSSGEDGAKFFFHDAYEGYLYKMLTVQLEGVNYFVPDNGTFNAAILDQTDHHIAITRTGTVLLFYVDGSLIGTRTIEGQPDMSSGNDLRIGMEVTNQNVFKGNIGDLRIWNIARTAIEINEKKAVLLTGAETGLLANWQMKEGEGQVAKDKTSNEYDAYFGSSLSNDDHDPVWNTVPALEITYPCEPGLGVALSNNELEPNTDGKLMYTIGQVNVTKMIGLTDVATATGNAVIDYAIQLNSDGNIYIYEGGFQVGETSYGAYGLNQELKIERVGSGIIYTVNNIILKATPTTTDPAKTLIVKTYLTDGTATIRDVQTDFCNQPALVIEGGTDPTAFSYTVTGAGMEATFNSGSNQTLLPLFPHWENASIQIETANQGGNTAIVFLEVDKDLTVISSSLEIHEGEKIRAYGVDNYVTVKKTKFGNIRLDLAMIDEHFGVYSTITDPNKNWTESKFFDENGNLVSAGKTYYNYLGNPTQTQALNLAENNVLVSETVYDAYGRGVLTTLPAPIYRSYFKFKDGFITSNYSGGIPYDYTQFDLPNYSSYGNNIIAGGELDNPRAVARTDKGTLGWYYSDNNTEEPYVATTYYPYSRVEYDVNNPGAVKRSSSPQNFLKMGSGNESKSFSMPASGELNYVFGYANGWVMGEDAILVPDANSNDYYFIMNKDLRIGYNVTKNIGVDADGNERISFIDTDGKLVATCYSGLNDVGQNENEYSVTSFISGDDYAERYVDIHIPEGTESYLEISNDVGPLGQPYFMFDILDLDKNTFVYENVNGQNVNLPPGYYRIISLPDNYSNKAVAIRHTLNYYDFTLYYYDKAGRLISTVAPNGVDKTYNPNIVSSFVDNKKPFYTDLNTQYLAGTVPTDEVQVTIPTTPVGDQQFSMALAYLTPNTSAVIIDVNPYQSANKGEGGTPQENIDGLAAEVSHVNISGDEAIYGIGYGGVGNGPGGGPALPVTYATPYAKKYVVYIEIWGIDNLINHVLLKNSSPYIVGKLDNGNWEFSVTPALAFSNLLGHGALIDVAASQTIQHVYAKIKNIKQYTRITTYPVGGPPAGIKSYVPTTPLSSNSLMTEVDLNIGVITKRFPGTSPIHTPSDINQYNSISQVLKNTNIDKGVVDYVYSEEGLLRFSRNDKQKANGTFSYTNYDEAGRPVESGEYRQDIVNFGVDNFYFQSHNNEYLALPHPLISTLQIANELFTTDISNSPKTSDVINIMYDYADPDFNTPTGSGLSALDYSQKVYLGDVSKTWTGANTGLAVQESTTWYSYDDQGRVIWMVQDIKGIGIKTIDYEYNVKGDLEKVIYQKLSNTEYFAHQYTYDASKRLINVMTSDDSGVSWDQQAHYEYYQHGPLKRTELADKLQGIDYLYTTLGQLKAINSPNIGLASGNKFIDPGKDGVLNDFATDVFGMSIDYFRGDYARTSKFVSSGDALDQMYNGNIRSVRWNTEGLPAFLPGDHWMYKYKYNKKQWLKSATFGAFIATSCDDPSVSHLCYTPPPGSPGHTYFYPDPKDNYKVSNLTYDPNGNILSLNRNAYGANILMDQFTYNYPTNGNKLDFISDAISGAPYDDLKNGQLAGNYKYDEIGQLIKNKEEDQYFTYNVSGLVTHVHKDELKQTLIAKYFYDDKNFRYKKEEYDLTVANNLTVKTYYIRDAAGVIQHVYTDNGGTLSDEYPIYASGRIGNYYRGGDYVYELTDHLGNIRATVIKSNVPPVFEYDFTSLTPDWVTYNSANTPIIYPALGKLVMYDYTASADFGIEQTLIPTVVGTRYELSFETGYTGTHYCNLVEVFDGSTVISSLAVTSIGNYTLSFIATSVNTTIRFIKNPTMGHAFYLSNVKLKKAANETTVVSYADYYPFGEKLPGRNFTSSLLYKYAYQGQEHDEETGLDAFELRLWDGRIGRWLSTDPYNQYHSPYLGMGNNPIIGIDPDGGYVDNPVYNTSGDLLGTTESGMQGAPIFLNESDFHQGMSDISALDLNLGFSSLNDLAAVDNFYNNGITGYMNLSTRPDWDGFLTKVEADAWWLGRSGALLYVDQSQIELPDVTTSDFVNGVYSENFIWDLDGVGLHETGKVYGTLGMTLLNAKTGQVRIGGNVNLDEYDFGMDTRVLRNAATWVGRPGEANEGVSFFIRSYGTATVPVR